MLLEVRSEEEAVSEAGTLVQQLALELTVPRIRRHGHEAFERKLSFEG